MRKVMLAFVVVAAAATFGAGAEPSDGCDNGQVPSSTTPAGVGANAGTGGSLVLCNTGAAVPSPAKGAATVSIDPTSQTGYVEVDGDSDNDAAACAVGFVRVKGSAAGPAFYESDYGSYQDTSPSAGNQQAEAESPDAWAQNVAANCAPA